MKNSIISTYPEWTPLGLDQRAELYPVFYGLSEGLSEFTFANLYLFRHTYHYRITTTPEGLYILTGQKDGHNFFLLPCGLPRPEILKELFDSYGYLKNATLQQVPTLQSLGYVCTADRDNFDYLYLKEELASLNGRKYHKKRNHVNAFLNSYSYRGDILADHNLQDALEVLEKWREGREDEGDYQAAREALEKKELLQLCGSIIYIEENPVAYTLGEELGGGTSFAIHFEKAIGDYKGIYQFINKCFATLLPDQYRIINREQDLGNPGLRHAKMSYQPHGFLEKFRVVPGA